MHLVVLCNENKGEAKRTGEKRYSVTGVWGRCTNDCIANKVHDELQQITTKKVV